MSKTALYLLLYINKINDLENNNEEHIFDRVIK
jgi:hypothetical protein